MGKTNHILKRSCPAKVAWKPGKRLDSRADREAVQSWIEGLNL